MQENNEVMSAKTNQVIEINANEVNPNEAQKKTKAQFVEMLQREFTEIMTITENVKQLKEDAKEAGYDAALLARVAKSLAESKVEDILSKNQEFADMIDEVQGE